MKLSNKHTTCLHAATIDDENETGRGKIEIERGIIHRREVAVVGGKTNGDGQEARAGIKRETEGQVCFFFNTSFLFNWHALSMLQNLPKETGSSVTGTRRGEIAGQETTLTIKTMMTSVILREEMGGITTGVLNEMVQGERETELATIALVLPTPDLLHPQDPTQVPVASHLVLSFLYSASLSQAN